MTFVQKNGKHTVTSGGQKSSQRRDRPDTGLLTNEYKVLTPWPAGQTDSDVRTRRNAGASLCCPALRPEVGT